MNFQRYMKQGQSLLLRVQGESSQNPRTELFAVSVVALDGNRILLSVPHLATSADDYPFEKTTRFEVTTEAMGMGVRVTGCFEKVVDNNCLAVKLESDLQLFQRQRSPRLDCELGIRFSRAAKTLHNMREIWQRNIDLLYSNDAPLVFDGFKPCRTNISSGGIRFIIKPPANQGELCLIMINLEDGSPPVCAIAETVWSCTLNDMAVKVGMRFINILSEDQSRIAAFIRKNQ